MIKSLGRITFVASMLCLVTACASGPTQQQVENADYGREITPSECIQIAEQVISGGLKDPHSAQFSHSPCFKGYWGAMPVMGMGVEFGWIQEGQVNGKNSFGGYVGFRSYQVLIKNGNVVRYCISDKDGFCIPTNR